MSFGKIREKEIEQEKYGERNKGGTKLYRERDKDNRYRHSATNIDTVRQILTQCDRY